MEFYDIALAKLLQTAPELGNYIVTFQDVSHEVPDSEEVQVGIFVLKNGVEIYYIPVVAKQNNVFPIDSIFVNSNSQFLPLTKKSILSIVSQTGMDPGVGTKIPKEVPSNPDLSRLINPPRTGKYVYASSSRLSEFLSILPNELKKFTMDKLAEEKTLRNQIHNMFGFDNIAKSLAPTFEKKASAPKAPVEVITEKRAGLSDEAVGDLIKQGYHVAGVPDFGRIAVSAQKESYGKFSQIGESDKDRDYMIVMADGTTRLGYIPKLHCYSHKKEYDRGYDSQNLALFADGSWANLPEGTVCLGEQSLSKSVLPALLNNVLPMLAHDLSSYEKVAALTPDGGVIGVFDVRKVVRTHAGTEITAEDLLNNYRSVRIGAYPNFRGLYNYESDGTELYINPAAVLFIRLKDRVERDSFEKNVNSASRKVELAEANFLGSMMKLAYDGYEFSINGQAVGSEANVVKAFVIDEGIHPLKTQQFIKEAKEQKFVRIYMSKKAAISDFGQPSNIPQFGAQPSQVPDVGLNGSFINDVRASAELGDPQTTEATVISELLQTPDMYEFINEYIPDIENALDRLGRILFVSRVNVQKLTEGSDVDGVFSFMSSLKIAYRILGDNLLKLKELVATRPVDTQETLQ